MNKNNNDYSEISINYWTEAYYSNDYKKLYLE